MFNFIIIWVVWELNCFIFIVLIVWFIVWEGFILFKVVFGRFIINWVGLVVNWVFGWILFFVVKDSLFWLILNC